MVGRHCGWQDGQSVGCEGVWKQGRTKDGGVLFYDIGIGVGRETFQGDKYCARRRSIQIPGPSSSPYKEKFINIALI